MDRPIEDDSSPASGRWTDRVRAISATRRDQLIVIGVAVLAHGWLVVNNGIYWDDWLLYTKLQRGDLAGVQLLADQVGGIPTYLYIWIAAAAVPPSAIGFKIVALLLIAGSGLLLYSICRESELVSPTEALLIACLGITYPADHTRVLLVTLNYLTYWYVFLLGVLLLMRSERATGRAKWALRLLALASFLFSFGLNSLLVFYFGALLFGILFLQRRKGLAFGRLIAEELPRRLDLVVAPFAFWFVYRAFFAPNGLYGDYHHFNLTLDSLTTAARGFWLSGVVAQFRDSLDGLAAIPLVWLAALFAVQRFWRSSGSDVDPLRARLATLGFGALLTGLAVFPYVAVGLAPNDHGWSSRNAILLGFPIAIMLVAGARILFPAKGGSVSVLGAAVLISLLLGFIVDTGIGYVGWEARWIKDSSVMHNLAATPGADRYSVYWMDSQYQLGGEPSYRFYEWAGMLDVAFGGQSRIGLDQDKISPKFLVDGRRYFIKQYNLGGGFDPAGCEARVVITPGPDPHSELGLVARYLFYGMVDPAKADRLVARATTVTVEPYSALQATDCARG